MSKTGKSRKRLWNVLTSTTALLCAVSITGTVVANQYASSVSAFLGISDYKVITDENADPNDSIYYAKTYDTEEEARAAGQALCEEIETEGSVLLKNSGALPMAAGGNVTLLGRASVDTVYGGTGSSATGDNNEKITLQKALESVGVSVNQTVLDFYTEMSQQEQYTRITSEDVNGTDWQLGEVGTEEFTDEVKASFADYSDAAIIMLSRSGGEGADLPRGTFVDGENYLALQECERDLIALAEENFDTVIVLLNSSNTMEIQELAEDEGVDAIVWIGQPGDTGLYGVADLLVGNANFSGKLVDTYVKDNLSAAAAQNLGDYTYANADEIEAAGAYQATSYIVESEGIYVGYRYYETRYEDCVLGQGNADGTAGTADGSAWNYTTEVVYPFGYGLSYTTYEQTLDNVTETDDGFDVIVTVTNTGSVAGREVVQIYAQSPYTDYDKANNVEKASVQLVGEAKTGTLEPGKSETVTVSVDKYSMTSYDYTGYKTYILEAGDYYLSVGSDAHAALNNILAAKGKTTADGMDADGDAALTYCWTQAETDAETYSVSATGATVTNQLENVDLNYYGDFVTYLTRQDWQGTFPTSYDSLTATEEMINDLNFTANYVPGDSDISSITTGADNDVQLISLRGLDYDDPLWDDLLDELTIDDMANFVGQSGFGYNAIPSIGSPATIEQDGPLGVCGNSVKGIGYGMTKYPCTVMLASTWDTEIAYQYGLMLGEEALHVGVNGIYAPGMNVHRTAYSGRNFEYYTEDSYLGGIIGAAEVTGTTEKGLRTYAKHFAMNDQEDNRRGVSTFVNEQACREIFLKQFELCIASGSATGVMNAYNRVGCYWTGACSGLLTAILHDEWGFNGEVLTDLGFAEPLNDPRWLQTSGGTNSFAISGFIDELTTAAQSDVKLLSAMRESCHRTLYVMVNSNLMNGIGANDKTVKNVIWWKYAMVGLDVVLGIAAAAFAVLYILAEQKQRADVTLEKEEA